ncbi:hypothetical protein CROQUDRAFT_107223 [Cronartium quercuum f. sp. fusiforme G11]|uniref:Uncharacterized protein n=1 Tax=Cronartium quercuum f. sp. fusiforme G11 TaxID=708437 RepID=A0A9P6NI13_9BASI|nr:hypothetical protein CROQUDRAFT_107223 [Cronartium quercuum f. sp. fusiforme G11]
MNIALEVIRLSESGMGLAVPEQASVGEYGTRTIMQKLCINRPRDQTVDLSRTEGISFEYRETNDASAGIGPCSHALIVGYSSGSKWKSDQRRINKKNQALDARPSPRCDLVTTIATKYIFNTRPTVEKQETQLADQTQRQIVGYGSSPAPNRELITLYHAANVITSRMEQLKTYFLIVDRMGYEGIPITFLAQLFPENLQRLSRHLEGPDPAGAGYSRAKSDSWHKNWCLMRGPASRARRSQLTSLPASIS